MEKKQKFLILSIVFAVLALLSIASLVTFIVIYVKEILDETGIIASVVALLFALALLAVFIYNYKVANSQKTREGLFSTKNITRIAIMTALSYVLYMFLKFPLPAIFPPWLDIQISDLPALICGFSMGPVPGCLVIFFKVLLKLPFSSSVCVGELADLLIGIAFVLPASLIYKYRRRMSGAVIGLIVGVIASTAVALLFNWLVLIPFYVQLYFGGSWDAIVGMLSGLYKNITVDNFYFWYLLVAALPFNLMRGIITAALTLLVYKSIGKLFNKMVPKRSN